MEPIKIEPGVMSRMADEHFIASVCPTTPLEKELYDRLVHTLDGCRAGNECLEGLQDDCLYLKDQITGKSL